MSSSMTIGKRFFVASGTLLVMNVVLSAVALLGFDNVEREVHALSTSTVPALFYAAQMSANLNTMRGNMLRGVLEPELAQKQQFENIVARSKQGFNESVHSYNSAVTTESEREDAARIFQRVESFGPGWEKMMALSHQSKTAEAYAAYNADVASAMSASRDQIDALVAKHKKVSDDAMSSATHAAETTLWITAVMSIASVILGIFVAWFMINGLNAQMGTIVAELSDGSEQIASAAGQVSSSSQSLAQGSSEQAASLQDTSASSEEINSMARKNSDNARQMAGLVGKSQDMFVRTNEQLEEMVVSMDEINESSGKISKIIKVIDEIAFQTNILALNAAVEAARAGEAGMGFAVVADEVRNLAQRSAQAAKDTAMLIEESIAKSNGGKMKVDQVATAIRDITRDSASVKLLVDEVTLGSEEQSRGLQQISKSIMQMEQVTQTTAATAEESAAAAQELNAQSESLKDIVGNLSAMLGGNAQPVSLGPSRSKPKKAATLSSAMGAFGSGRPAAASSSRKASQEDMGAFPLEAAFKEF